MKKFGLIILFYFSLISCWAPKCPVNGCQFVREHRHSDLVSGTFRSRYLVFPKIHFPFDGTNKGEKLASPDIAPKGTSKKVRKKYPWERW